MLWKLAWRNLWRHRARTVTMISAVALAYALLLVGMGISDDSHTRMLEEAAQMAGGDVLVHGAGYWATRASDIVVDDAERTVAAVRGAEGARAVLPRVIVNGLVGTSADTRPVLLYGIRPELETEMHDVAGDVTAGTFLADGRAPRIVLGTRLAEQLDVGIGDRVVLTATGPDGEITRALFQLSGIHASGQRQADELVAYTTLDAARRALGMDDQLTQIGVLAAAGVESGALARSVEAALGAAAEPALEVLTWQEAVPEMVGFIEIDDAFGLITVIVLYAVVLFSITNTFLMAVMERVREFGLLNALGLRDGRIGRLLLAETTLMVAIALGIGLTLALGGHLALDHWGINTAVYGVEEMEISGIDMSDMVLRSRIAPMKWLAASVIIAVATIASALYPAWRASRLAPAEAMRFYE